MTIKIGILNEKYAGIVKGTGHPLRSIATQLGRAPSTISREIKRSGGQQGYCANQADQLAWDRARHLRTCKLVENRTLAHIVRRQASVAMVAANSQLSPLF